MDKQYKEKIDAFLKRHNFSIDDIIFQTSVFDSLITDMKKGLCGEDSSIQMINTKCKRPELTNNRRVLTLDVGGTNVRASVVAFDEKGIPTIEHITKMSTAELLSKEDFFNALATFIIPDIIKNEDITHIAMCFSFPFCPTDDNDGIISGSAKGLNVARLQGKKILLSLKNALSMQTERTFTFSIINDSTSVLYYLSLLSAKEKDNPILIGSIVGTGCNSCLYLKKKDEATAICTEIGHANLSSVVLSDFDYTVDRGSFAPGSSIFEILTSGFYLYKVVKEIFRVAIDEDVFEDGEKKKALIFYESLNDTKDLDKGFILGGGIAYIMLSFVKRSAVVLSQMILSSACLSTEEGTTDSKNVSVLIEGSTYYLFPHYKEYTEEYTKKLLSKNKYNVTFYYPTDNKGTIVLYGTAISR